MSGERRVALFILGVIVFTTVATGSYLALVSPTGILGSTPSETPTPTATATPTATNASTPTGTATATGTPTATATATPQPTPTPRAAPVDDAAVLAATRARLTEYLDDPRTSRNEAPWFDSETARALSKLAQNQSDLMAGEGYVSDTVAGVSPADRYAQSRRLDGCHLVDRGGNYVVPKSEQVVVYAVDVRGRSDEALGTAVADGLMSDREMRHALSLQGASSMGIGLNTTERRAYVTVAVC